MADLSVASVPHPRNDEIWRMQGFIIYDGQMFVYVNGALTAFPQCGISYPERTEMVREGLYRRIGNRLGLDDADRKKTLSKLVIAPESRWMEFQCPLMPPRLSAYPLGYLHAVTVEQEIVLLEEIEHGRDPRDIEIFRETVGNANIDFLRHMFGIGEFRRPCIPCQAIVEAHRTVHHGKRENYFLMDEFFPLPQSAEIAIAV